jgi:hypothetical protein
VILKFVCVMVVSFSEMFWFLVKYTILSFFVEINVLYICISEFGKRFETHTEMYINIITVKLFYAWDAINDLII